MKPASVIMKYVAMLEQLKVKKVANKHKSSDKQYPKRMNHQVSNETDTNQYSQTELKPATDQHQ